MGDDLFSDTAAKFRSPHFLQVWERWQKARATWEKAWKKCDIRLVDPFRPDPASAGVFRIEAQEFVDARDAYREELKQW